MKLNVDFLIDFFKRYSDNEKEEIGEQDAATGGDSSSSGSGPAMPKWADVHGGPKRGKANMLGKKGEKWQTGLTRGVANQVW